MRSIRVDLELFSKTRIRINESADQIKLKRVFNGINFKIAELSDICKYAVLI